MADVDAKMNPYDLYALESALRLKEQYGGLITVITVGPPPSAEGCTLIYAQNRMRSFMLKREKPKIRPY